MSFTTGRNLTLLCIALVFSACAPLTRTSDPLEGSNWTLESLGPTNALESNKPTLRFSEGLVRGSAGCNSFQGDYSITGQKIAFSELAMTLMACPEPEGVMDQEQSYVRALQQVDRFEFSEGRLILKTKSETDLTFTQLLD
jgi:heat shock protein HslJ